MGNRRIRGCSAPAPNTRCNAGGVPGMMRSPAVCRANRAISGIPGRSGSHASSSRADVEPNGLTERVRLRRRVRHDLRAVCGSRRGTTLLRTRDGFDASSRIGLSRMGPYGETPSSSVGLSSCVSPGLIFPTPVDAFDVRACAVRQMRVAIAASAGHFQSFTGCDLLRPNAVEPLAEFTTRLSA
jgi:hypothetical protein